AAPETFTLSQNYPNPFNPGTSIQFGLPRASAVMLAIYNLRGQMVRMLINREFPAGNHEIRWDGKNDKGQTVASGMYMYKIHAANFVARKKLLLTR
ncbi:MAG: FlgD immunoglobulin-like domain containing protein, partial [bacterium]